jgi:hypothetical protein
MTQLGSRNKSHQLDFLEDFHRCLCPLAPILTPYLAPDMCVLFLKCHITSDALIASLNNSFKDYWHLCIGKTCMNYMIIMADCKEMGFIQTGIKGSQA